MITYVKVPIGTGGVPACVACAMTKDIAPLPLAAVDDALGRAAARVAPGAVFNVALTGIEAFSHPELPRLIGAARAHGADRIRLSTDGRFLAQGGNAYGAVSAGVTHLELVLVGGDAAAHDRLTKRPGAFDSACAGAREFIAAARSSALLSGRIPLCRHAVADAPATVALLASLGAVAVELDASSLNGSPAHAGLLAAACETATVNRVAAWVTGWDGELPVPYVTPPWRTEDGVAA